MIKQSAYLLFTGLISSTAANVLNGEPEPIGCFYEDGVNSGCDSLMVFPDLSFDECH